MAKYLLDIPVTETNGSQTFEVEADNMEDAAKQFKRGEGKFVREEIEVVSLGEVSAEDIYEG